MKATDKTIATRYGRIQVSDTEGSGLPVVFLHGWGGCRQVFERQGRPQLLEKSRVIVVDLPGHGRSEDASDPQAAYTLRGLADTVEEVLADLRVERFAIVGWALGGNIAIELMARSRAVSGLLLTGSSPVSPGLIGMLRGFHASMDLFRATPQHRREREVAKYEKLCFGSTGTPYIRDALMRADGRLRTAFLRSLIRGDGHDQRRIVQTADVPIFLVHGAEDPFVRSAYLEGFDDRRLDHHAALVADAGHAVFRQRPEPFNALLDRFVDLATKSATGVGMPLARVG